MARVHRIEIGFAGDQVIAMKLAEDQLAALRKALPKGGWQTVLTDDGEVDLDVSKVAFLRIAADGQSVGFGQQPG
jgi:hypothetical protein